jgi:hypothetical protein
MHRHLGAPGEAHIPATNMADRSAAHRPSPFQGLARFQAYKLARFQAYKLARFQAHRLIGQKMTSKIGYARVSTFEQDLDVQIAALKAAGCDVVRAEKRSGTSTKARTSCARCSTSSALATC